MTASYMDIAITFSKMVYEYDILLSSYDIHTFSIEEPSCGKYKLHSKISYKLDQYVMSLFYQNIKVDQ